MTTHFEEDSTASNLSAKLLNREVMGLLFSYLSRYRRHLFTAIAFIVFISAARLLVPYLSGYIVDHLLVKKGYAVSLAASPADLACRKPCAAALRSTTPPCFFFRTSSAGSPQRKSNA